ncbi:MAG: hypothetical protein ACEQSX_06010 [Baekduiaceae bacterium]
MSRSLSLLAAALLTAALVAIGAHSASGQTTPTTPSTPVVPGLPGVTIKGSTVIRIDPILFETLTAAGAKVRAGKPATATKTGVKFKVTSISLGKDGQSYLLKHKGEMRISTASRSLRIKNPTTSVSQTTGQGELTATVAGKRVKLAALQIDIGALEQTGSGINADNVNLAMNARLASELNRLLPTPSVLEGATFGKATLKVITEA